MQVLSHFRLDTTPHHTTLNAHTHTYPKNHSVRVRARPSIINHYKQIDCFIYPSIHTTMSTTVSTSTSSPLLTVWLLLLVLPTITCFSVPPTFLPTTGTNRCGSSVVDNPIMNNAGRREAKQSCVILFERTTNPNSDESIHQMDDTSSTIPSSTRTRRRTFFRLVGTAVAGIGMGSNLVHPQASWAGASYSSNARNMERLSSGDSSGGSVYDNNPTTNRGKNRRALTGCKIPSTREEASAGLGLSKTMSEQDCNIRVLDGDAEFMLSAIRKLDCPTCPYGINPKRD